MKIPMQSFSGCRIAYIRSDRTIIFLDTKGVASNYEATWTKNGHTLDLERTNDGFYAVLKLGKNTHVKRFRLGFGPSMTGLPTAARWTPHETNSLSLSLSGSVHFSDCNAITTKFPSNDSAWLGGDSTDPVWDSSAQVPIFFRTDWKHYYDDFPQTRVNRLLADYAPVDIFIEIRKANSRATDCRWTESSEKPGYYRMSFRLEVGKETFDRFFNGPLGIRAHYAMGVIHSYIGDQFNSQLINTGLGLYEGGGGYRPVMKELYPNVNPDLFEKSIKAQSAKVWMWEGENGLPGNSDAEFPVSPWYKFKSVGTGDPITKLLEMDATEVMARARWGCYAPERCWIEFKGGWVDDQGNEWIAPNKRSRSAQIGYLGFS